MARIICISVVLAALTHSAYSLREDLEYQLDVLGDNNLERIDKEVIDPGVTVFKPINDAEIGVVKYGDETIWKRSGKKHLLLLRVFKVLEEDNFMNLFYHDGKKVFAMVFAKNGEKWKNTGKYQIKNPEEVTGEPLSKLRSTFRKEASDDSSETSLDSNGDEEENAVDLDLGGYVEDIAKVKEYYSTEVFTTEYRPFGDKAVKSVTDKYQTIWKFEPGSKPLRQMFRYSKKGYVPLLHICTGMEPFDSGDKYYERVKDEWMPVNMDQFLKRLTYAMTGEIDPQFDQGPEVYEEQPPFGAFATGNNLAHKSTWSEYPYSMPYVPTSTKSVDSEHGRQRSGADSLKKSVQEVPVAGSQESQPESGSYEGPLSQSSLKEAEGDSSLGLKSDSSLNRTSGSYPEENERRMLDVGLDDDIIDLTKGYEMVSLPSGPMSLSSNPDLKSNSALI
ncbi:conserved hypothetical protein [Theileria orientalis strain Shintoku]|uniref:Uncharacterized protein n=1 Tax=Theileria orientalis strain Shintoku TaxID=869250 RepID=J7M8B5_THEOR|nr:conserved hypothetical protein [Theileria orientalis strain Shintoku]PVC54232.1 hypothetical protein MACL_00003199 [Theileria orientalis]BAM38698.1 conserved hypothetical protein [Theileria orientalis strain Shintoku]|eukprot:XP_009688999.1 conserved hypothetical protein [Theileria orientalis strain Shintoku]